MKNSNQKKVEKFISNILLKITDIKSTKESERTIINITKFKKIIKKYIFRISEKNKIKSIKKKVLLLKKNFNDKMISIQRRLSDLNTHLLCIKKKPEINYGRTLIKKVDKTNSSHIVVDKETFVEFSKTVNSSPNDLNKYPPLEHPKSGFFEGIDFNSDVLNSPKRLSGSNEFYDIEEIDEQLDTINYVKNYINQFKTMLVVDPTLKESKNKVLIKEEDILNKFFRNSSDQNFLKKNDSICSNINPLTFF